MSQILIISDTHQYNEIYEDILKHHPNVDYIIHAGDSCLNKDDPLLENTFVVKGNHDFEDFTEYIVHHPFFICHGHTFNVYKSFDGVIDMAKKNHCSIVIHGHTHICYDDIYQGIRIINPGSAMFNRGCYGYGTYALMETENQKLTFHHHGTHEDVTNIVVEDGKKTFQEFKDLIAEFDL